LAKIDEQKEIISNIRLFLLVFIGSFFGLASYVFNNFEKLSELKLIFLTFLGVYNFILIILLMFFLQKETKKLRDL